MSFLKLIYSASCRSSALMLTILTLLNLGFSEVVHADECSDLAKKNLVAKSGPSIEDFQWSYFGEKNVVLIGDEHTSSKPADIVRVANAIKSTYISQESACLFLEFPTSLSLDKFKEILSSDTGNAEQMRYIRYYKAMLEGAESSGFNVHLVDHADHLEKDVPINERDRAIAENISKLLESRTCSKGIMVVGKAHITPDEVGRKLVRENLSELGRTSSTINIQYANETVAHPRLKSWNGLCPNNAEPLVRTSVFSNQPISQLALYPLYTPLSLLGYFDFTVLFP